MPQRLAEMLQRLTNQLNGVLFPVVVDSDAGQKPERLRAIFIQGTRLSLVSGRAARRPRWCCSPVR